MGCVFLNMILTIKRWVPISTLINVNSKRIGSVFICANYFIFHQCMSIFFCSFALQESNE